MTRCWPAIGAVLLATIALAGCHHSADEPGAVTPDEQAQLNDAAAMLDANSLSANLADPGDNTDDQP